MITSAFLNNNEKITEEDILNSLRSQQETLKLKYVIAWLLFDLGVRNDDLDKINESIEIFEEIKEQDFDQIVDEILAAL